MNASLVPQISLPVVLESPSPLDRNPAAVYIASLGGPKSSGGRTQAQALRVIASIFNSTPDSLDWSALRYEHTAAIRARIAQSYATATANKMLSALRQTLKHAWLLGQIPADAYQRAVQIKPITGETVPAGRHLSEDEIRALLDACKADPNRAAGARDAAMIALMYIALLRREEVIKLKIEDYVPSSGRLLVHGKRSKQRTNYITNGAKAALDAWIAIRGTSPGALFVKVNEKSGKPSASHKHLTSNAVYNMAAKRGAQAGLDSFSPHDFRRTGATDYLAAGEDALTVSGIGGWSDPKTLKRYDRRGEDAKQQAATKLHVPY